MFLRVLYSLLWLFLSPLVLIKLYLRGRKQPEYRGNVAERFAIYSARALNNLTNRPIIWIHAVSLGETRAILPLCQKIAEQYPKHQILLTAMTPTGRSAAKEIATQITIPTQIVYCPYDEYFAVRRFLNNFQIKIALICETEVWPNLIFACKQRKIPILLINGRLSDKSFSSYQKYLWIWLNLFRPAWAAFNHVAAQSIEDAERIKQIGANNITVVGNLKFDLQPTNQLLQQGKLWRTTWLNQIEQNLVNNLLATNQQIKTINQQNNQTFIILLASSREGEEEMFLQLINVLNKNDNIPSFRAIIVPRHPQRFNQVIELVNKSGFSYFCRSDGVFSNDKQILIGNSLGEMPAYYGMADIALIGGSFANFGGQNLIEACACATPVLLGLSLYNFQAASIAAIEEGAALQISHSSEKKYADGSSPYPEINQLIEPTIQILADVIQDKNKLLSMKANSSNFVNKYRGASSNTMKIIEKYLN